MTRSELASQIDAVRRFNRFYTRQIGVLREGLLDSPFTLTEARVVWELAHRDGATATDLSATLGLDAGYLSRILRSFQRRGLVARTTSEEDGRRVILSLTDEGREAFGRLNAASRREVGGLLERLDAVARARLVRSMEAIEEILLGRPEERAPYVLRPHEPGDLGWVVERHGTLYHLEYGWDERFEALVAGVVADFVRTYDPVRERCWIAEKDGERVGSVFLVRHPDAPETLARLRLLLVEPSARGLGLGRRLVGECTRFARRVGYQRITLWTNDVLHAARRIYEREGYRLVRTEPHRSFGHDLVGETWELEL
jgi:DNA-binding MarR family transcriptional regulator/GNAT superfamily N-acetyltransferase